MEPGSSSAAGRARGGPLVADPRGVEEYWKCKRLINQVINSTVQYRRCRMSVERAEEILEKALNEIGKFQQKSLRVKRRRDMVARMLALHRRVLIELWHCGGQPDSHAFFIHLSGVLEEMVEFDRPV